MKFTTRRFIGNPVRIVGRMYTDYAQELQEFLEKILQQVQGGVPAGFNDITPEILNPNDPGSPGTEADGWAAADHIHGLDLLLTTKGDLLTKTVSAYQRLGVGADGSVLEAASGEATGLKWSSVSINDVATRAFVFFMMHSADG